MKHSSKVDGRPAFQFYPDDWLAETGLRLCSLAARGLWMDCLCIAFHSPERGVLRKQNGSKILSKELAKMVGVPESEVDALLAELEQAGVSSKSPDGAVYNRRMVKDEHIRQVRADAGRVGGFMGGRPAKSKQKGKAKKPPPSPTPSPSSSPTPQKQQPAVSAVEFRLAWDSQVANVPKIRDWTKAREARLRARATESFWVAHWREALSKIGTSAFLQGGGSTGWKADVDWFLKPESVTRIMEGRYDGNGTSGVTENLDAERRRKAVAALKAADERAAAKEAVGGTF